MLSNLSYYSNDQILLQLDHRHFQRVYHLNVNIIRRTSENPLLNRLFSISFEGDMISVFTMYDDIIVWRYLFTYYQLSIKKLLCVYGPGQFIDCTFCSNPYCLVKFFQIGNLKLIDFLVRYFKLTSDHIRSNNNNLFISSCSRCDLDVIKYLNETFDPSVNDVRSWSGRALMSCCLELRLETVKYLVETFGLDTDDVMSSDVLVESYHSDNLSVFRYLIETFDFDVDDIGFDDCSVLEAVCHDGCLDGVKLLAPYFRSKASDITFFLNKLTKFPNYDTNDEIKIIMTEFAQLLISKSNQ